MWSKYTFQTLPFMSSNSNSIERCWMIQKRDSHFSPWVCRGGFLAFFFHSGRFRLSGSRLSSRSTSLTLMMRITSLIRLSFCTKLGRYGTLAPVLQTRLCLPPATTKVSPTVSFCLRLYSPPLWASRRSILFFLFLFHFTFVHYHHDHHLVTFS